MDSDDPVVAYLEGRGFDAAWLQAHGCAPSTEEDPVGPGHVRFEYRNLMGVWYSRYRLLDSKLRYWAEPGSVSHLYNPSIIGPTVPVLTFCEGEFDTLAANAAGVPAIGIPGTGNARFKAEWVHLFAQVPRIIIAFDGDEAGRKAATTMAQAWNQAEIFETPEGKDLNDMLLDGSITELRELHDKTFDKVVYG